MFKRGSIKVPSEIRSIRKVSSKILSGLSAYRLDENRLFDIRLCTEEAVRNAVIHGNRLDKKLYVRINYRIGKDRINIEVEDDGKGFDYHNLPDPTNEENIMKSSGRGIYLIRSLMDEVKFSDKGNKISLVKYLK